MTLLAPSTRPRTIRTIGSVTIRALRSTLVITVVALTVFAVRERSFDLPTLLRVVQDNQATFLLVFAAAWIWRYWRVQRETAKP